MYEVFISFKNLDRNGNQTPDSRIAARLYEMLTAAGVNVFFSNAEIQRKADPEYGKFIDRALREARAMIVVGSRLDYVESEWVDYEWRYFSNQRKAGRDKRMVTVIDGFPTADLPPAFSEIQSYGFDKLPLAVDMVLGMLGKRWTQPINNQTKVEQVKVEQAEIKQAKVENIKYIPTKSMNKKHPINPVLALIVVAALCIVLACISALSGNNSAVNDMTFLLRNNGTYAVVNYNGNDMNVDVPAEYNGLPVTKIASGTFSCSDIKKIVIPDSVTTIGDHAFNGCISLASITIPDSVTSIGNNVFSGCISLASITIPDSVTSIGNEAFYGCSNLESITIPDSVTNIGERAFRGCSITVHAPHTPSYYGEKVDYSGTGKVTWVVE